MSSQAPPHRDLFLAAAGLQEEHCDRPLSGMPSPSAADLAAAATLADARAALRHCPLRAASITIDCWQSGSDTPSVPNSSLIKDASGVTRVLSPSTEAEWNHAESLISELKDWDVRQSQTLGFAQDEVLDVFYPDNIEEIRRQSVLPDGCFAIVLDSSDPAGCAGFRRLTSETCELYDVYVRPEHRGRGIGSTLLQHLLNQARAAGYETMRLETASFMLTAHNLYRSLQFQVREPYRSIPARFADVTIWMERKLAG